jgi:ComF family protein
VWGGLVAATQAVVDFLVDERCHACQRLVGAMAMLALPCDGASAALATPVRIGSTRIGIDTHPLCRVCCHALVPGREPITIARARTDGSITLASGGVLPNAGAGAPVLAVWPAFATDDRLLTVIHAFKFSRHERLAPWLARALASGLSARALVANAILVPVPISRGSLRRRGFNQAERLATSLSALTKIPTERRALVKTRATAAQSTLDGAARVRNVAGAMAVVAPERIAGRHVVLVDDLVTTGATAAACASALWRAGASEVRVVCVGYRP